MKRWEVIDLRKEIRCKLVMITGLIFLLFFTSSCTNSIVDEYKEKTIDSMADFNVRIKNVTRTDKVDLFLKFEQKEIPYEMKIVCGDYTDRGTIEVTGSLGEGEMIIKVFSTDTNVAWSQKYSSGSLKDQQEFEIYAGNYPLHVEFRGAKDGDVHIKYRTNKLFGIL